MAPCIEEIILKYLKKFPGGKHLTSIQEEIIRVQEVPLTSDAFEHYISAMLGRRIIKKCSTYDKYFDLILITKLGKDKLSNDKWARFKKIFSFWIPKMGIIGAFVISLIALMHTLNH